MKEQEPTLRQFDTVPNPYRSVARARRGALFGSFFAVYANTYQAPIPLRFALQYCNTGDVLAA